MKTLLQDMVIGLAFLPPVGLHARGVRRLDALVVSSRSRCGPGSSTCVTHASCSPALTRPTSDNVGRHVA